MSASFQIFMIEMQKLLKADIIGNIEKARMASIIWPSLSKDRKDLYKLMAKTYNICHALTGRRKLTGFWLFASHLLDELRVTDIPHKFVQDIFENMNEESQLKFKKLNDICTVERTKTIYEMLNETTCNVG